MHTVNEFQQLSQLFLAYLHFYIIVTRVCVLLGNYNDEVAGNPLFFNATWDPGELKNLTNRLRQRKIGIYLSTQWDMHIERDVFLS